ncbi:MAG: HPr family phosphocarrier protein [Spirochaetota bacterium]|nr:HPr family phosphocarrier protein [Spirochaetota bacterium]
MSNRYSKRIKVKNHDGIHARPSVKIVEMANKFSSNIIIKKGNLSVDGKSILDILTLAACFGTELIVEADGDDAKEAVEAVSALFAQEFNFKPLKTNENKGESEL